MFVCLIINDEFYRVYFESFLNGFPNSDVAFLSMELGVLRLEGNCKQAQTRFLCIVFMKPVEKIFILF